MKLYKLFIYLFIFGLLFPKILMAEILFKDPTEKQFNEYIKSLSFDDFKENLTHKKSYVLAFLSLDGDEELKINKNCSKGVNLLRALSKENIADADYTLSSMYYYGICVNKNLEKSRFFLEKSANLGFILAERDIGSSYYGQKFDKLYPDDITKAIYWFKLAANSGDMGAASILSHIYNNGVKGIKVNKREAFKWKLKAANSTLYFDDDVLVNFDGLAEFYEKGIGTDKDLVKAYKYYILSGNAGAKGESRVVKEMTPEQIKEGQRLANEWMEKYHVHIFETY